MVESTVTEKSLEYVTLWWISLLLGWRFSIWSGCYWHFDIPRLCIRLLIVIQFLIHCPVHSFIYFVCGFIMSYSITQQSENYELHFVLWLAPFGIQNLLPQFLMSWNFEGKVIFRTIQSRKLCHLKLEVQL